MARVGREPTPQWTTFSRAAGTYRLPRRERPANEQPWRLESLWVKLSRSVGTGPRRQAEYGINIGLQLRVEQLLDGRVARSSLKNYLKRGRERRTPLFERVGHRRYRLIR